MIMSIKHQLITDINEENFDSEVLESNLPVVVDFWAHWCRPCQRIAPVLDEVAVSFLGRAKVGKVNVDESPNLIERFGIKSIPTLLYFGGGQLRHRTIGLVDKYRIANDLSATAEQKPAVTIRTLIIH
jgi:thioredoxin 1